MSNKEIGKLNIRKCKEYTKVSRGDAWMFMSKHH